MIGKSSPSLVLLPDDVLLYMHIPKTGGTSLMKVLDDQFPPGQVFPLHSAREEGALDEFLPDRIRDYRFVRGHYAFGRMDRHVYRHIVQLPRILTVLRRPVDRIVSLYGHAKRVNNQPWMNRVVSLDQSLKEFVEDPKHAGQVVNAQARVVACLGRGVLAPSNRGGDAVEAALVTLARERLEQFVFVGILEAFAETVAGICATFGWTPPAEIPFRNVSPGSSRDRAMDAETQAAIEARTALDLEVYQHGRSLLAAQLARLGLGRQAGAAGG